MKPIMELDEDGMNRTDLKKLGYKGKQLDIISYYYSCMMGDETTVKDALFWTSEKFPFMTPKDVENLIRESLQKEGLSEKEIREEGF